MFERSNERTRLHHSVNCSVRHFLKILFKPVRFVSDLFNDLLMGASCHVKKSNLRLQLTGTEAVALETKWDVHKMLFEKVCHGLKGISQVIMLEGII